MDENFTYIDKAFAQTLANGEKHPKLLLFLSSLLKCTREGLLFLEGFQEIENLLEPLCNKENSPLVKFENSYYLRRIWELETTALFHIKRLLHASPKLSITPKSIPEDLYTAQKTAFEKIFSSPLTVISGGPGSGKTFFASRLIQTVLQEKPNATIISAAPTGKAASKLRFQDVRSRTLHSLLHIHKRKEETPLPLIADLILIDECSMIDLELWSLLLSSIESGAHVVLIGDPHQLPPVETIGIFASLCSHPHIPHIYFDQSIRTDKSGILNLAYAIQAGDIKEVFSLFTKHREISLYPLPQTIPIDKRTLLSPFVKGPYGTNQCNHSIDSTLQEPIKPIVIEKNAPSLNLVNGDMGVIEKERAFFTLQGEKKSFPKAILPPYSLAYAVTVHKSQGSEFPHVSLLLPEESEKFGKELLYTAVTRAKESLTLYAAESTLKKILEKNSTPSSHFNKRLSGYL